MAEAPSPVDLRFLLGAFAAVVVTFFTANVVTQRAMQEIDAASDELAFNAAPSIHHLAALRGAVRHAQFLVGAELTARDGAPGRAAIDTALDQVTQEANAYLSMPTFPGEKDFWTSLNVALTRFRGGIDRALAQLDAGKGQDARAGLSRIASDADAVVAAAARAIDFNARNGRDLAMRIKTVRSNAGWIGYALNALCAMFAVAAALLVRRQLNRHDALVHDHAVLQEIRATELENFAGRAAHDILNPVSATQMALALAARAEISEERRRELVERALNNQRRVRTIIDGLLQFARSGARAQAGAVANVPVVVQDVIEGVRSAADRAGIEVRAEEILRCWSACSEGVLTSVISNLAHNAIKYMGEGEVRRITVRAHRRGAFVHLEVEDTGPGIPSDALDDIFRPYVRGPTHGQDGLGLGLATVKRLCEAHGGDVGVRSAVGEGSLFWIEIPLAPPPPEHHQTSHLTQGDSRASEQRSSSRAR